MKGNLEFQWSERKDRGGQRETCQPFLGSEVQFLTISYINKLAMSFGPGRGEKEPMIVIMDDCLHSFFFQKISYLLQVCIGPSLVQGEWPSLGYLPQAFPGRD